MIVSQVYHIQSDELLGSWLFLIGTVIFVPYCTIFAVSTTSKLLYLGLLAVAVIVSFGTYLFVRACYPTEEEVRRPIGCSCVYLINSIVGGSSGCRCVWW